MSRDAGIAESADVAAAAELLTVTVTPRALAPRSVSLGTVRS